MRFLWEEVRMECKDHIAAAFHTLCDDVAGLRHRHYWMKGGRGSTKSSCASLLIAAGLREDPEANAIIYRKVKDTLYDSVYAQMAWALERLDMLEDWRLGKSPMEMTCITGQKILFRGADDPAKSKSIKTRQGYFKYIWFEELPEFGGMEEIRAILQSLIRGGGPVACLYSFNPPKSAQNWVNAEALVVRPDRLLHHSTYLQVPPAWLGEAFMLEAEALRDANETAYRHEYLGEITGTGGQVFDNLRIRDIPEAERAGFDKVRLGLDFGFAVDPAALVLVCYAPGQRTLYLLEEFYAAGASYDTLAEEAGRMGAYAGTVIADSAEPRSISELSQRGVRITGAKKGPGSVAHGIRWLQDLRAIVIDPARCPNAAREFSGYEYERDRAGGFRADYPDKENHTIDAVRYALEGHMARRVARVRSRRGLPI